MEKCIRQLYRRAKIFDGQFWVKDTDIAAILKLSLTEMENAVEQTHFPSDFTAVLDEPESRYFSASGIIMLLCRVQDPVAVETGAMFIRTAIQNLIYRP